MKKFFVTTMVYSPDKDDGCRKVLECTSAEANQDQVNDILALKQLYPNGWNVSRDDWGKIKMTYGKLSLIEITIVPNVN